MVHNDIEHAIVEARSAIQSEIIQTREKILLLLSHVENNPTMTVDKQKIRVIRQELRYLTSLMGTLNAAN